MKDWTKTMLGPDATVLAGLRTINEAGLQVALVVDTDRKLLGTLTDGDVRRGILRGLSLDAPVTEMMHRTPRVAWVTDPPREILELMRTYDLRQVPIVDAEYRVVGLETLLHLLDAAERPNPVVLLAGGLGTRLRPLTESLPKPLVKVGPKPILETVIENLMEHGFRDFYISINYKADLIREHFEDGRRWGARIAYLVEDKRLGTAGPLSLLPQPPTHPIVVMNADILTKVNFGGLLDFHAESRSDATMCVREYHFQVPYGAVETVGHTLVRITEKPVHRFLISAGIYVLSPGVLDVVPRDTYFDMPALFERLLGGGGSAAVFPVHEYWIDVGQLAEYEKAKDDYGRHFGRSEADPPPVE